MRKYTLLVILLPICIFITACSAVISEKTDDDNYLENFKENNFRKDLLYLAPEFRDKVEPGRESVEMAKDSEDAYNMFVAVDYQRYLDKRFFSRLAIDEFSMRETLIMEELLDLVRNNTPLNDYEPYINNDVFVISEELQKMWFEDD